MRRALVIVNPIAGRGAGERRLDELRSGLRGVGLAVEVRVTARPGDAREMAAEAEAHDLVAVAGGDGTLNEVLNGLEADRPVAVLPLGTGNVAAKEFGLPRRVGRFCQMVARGRELAVDLGAANGRRFIAMVGAGFDADVAAELAAGRSGAIRMARYVGPVLRHLARRRVPRIAVSVDGAQAAEAQGFALVSNVHSYGGPFEIAPQAKPCDGLLDVCVLPRGGLLRYSRAMLAFILRCWRLSGARYLRGRAVLLTSREPVRYQVDGDPAGWLPADVELLERKLRLIVP